MNSNGPLISVIIAYALLLIGAGALVTYRFPFTESLTKRLCARFILGAAVLPTALIALHELFGVRVHPATAFAIGLFGLVLLVHDEYLRYRDRRTKALLEDELSDEAYMARLTTWLEDIVLLLLTAGVFATCFVAGTKYPLMEAWDPWGHALGVHYVWETGSLRQPFAGHPLIHYVDAYPPLYDVLMCIPCGLVGSMNAPLKATNFVLVAAAIPAFFMLARDISGNRRLAMLATIVYAVIPSNLTRHVWGHSAATVFTLAGLAFAMRARTAWCWIVPGACCFAGALLAAPTAGIMAGIVLILATGVILFVSLRWFWRVIALGTLALSIAMIWYLPVFMRYGTDLVTLKVAMDGPVARRKTSEAIAAGVPEKAPNAKAPFAGATARYYNLDDFLFFRPYQSILYFTGQKVDSHIVPSGIGLPVALLVVIFLVSCVLRWVRGPERVGWREILLAWLVFSLVGVLGKHTGFVFFVWRFWLIFVPFAVIAAAEGLLFLGDQWSKSSWARVTFALLLVGIGINLAGAEWFDATSKYSPWPDLKDAHAFVAVALGACLWLGADLLVMTDRAGRLVGVLITSVILMNCLIEAPIRAQKLSYRTSDHIFLDRVEYEGYIRTYYRTLPGDRIWPMAAEQRCQIVVGLDRECALFRKDEFDFFQRLSRKPDSVSTHELVTWLREHRYEYLVLDPVYQFLLTNGKPSLGNGFETRVDELCHAPGVELVLGLPHGPTPLLSQFYLFRIRTDIKAD